MKTEDLCVTNRQQSKKLVTVQYHSVLPFYNAWKLFIPQCTSGNGRYYAICD